MMILLFQITMGAEILYFAVILIRNLIFQIFVLILLLNFHHLVTRDDDEFLPSAIRIRISLNNNIFSNILVNQLLIGDKIYSINEFNQDFASRKKQNYSELFGNINYNRVNESSDFTETDENDLKEEINTFDVVEKGDIKTLTKKL